MNIEQQLIFLFSALGATNGFLLSIFFFRKGKQQAANYFLSGLLLMLSIRTIKSVFYFFNPQLFEFFIQFGLAACFLIGPFLFLYVQAVTRPESKVWQRWWWHILPYLLIFLVFSYTYSYRGNRPMWGWFIKSIYKQWMIYILISGYLLWPVLQKTFKRKEKWSDQEAWVLNILVGTAVVWFAYETVRYTSYIVGALSFTFLLYVSGLLWFYRRTGKQTANEIPLKYANSSLSDEDVQKYKQQLEHWINDKKPHLHPDLTLKMLSDQLGINSKQLSQVINQSTGQNYSQYIAHLRILEAQQRLRSPQYENYKIAAIAYDCGFNSLSSFNTHFKRIVGKTAKEFKKDPKITI